MGTTKKLSNIQLELLKIFSFDLSEKQINEIKVILTKYFADNISDQMDELFKDKNWGEDQIERWSKEHMKSKYIKPIGQYK